MDAETLYGRLTPASFHKIKKKNLKTLIYINLFGVSKQALAERPNAL
jgi:hypothetical protein